MPAIFISSWVRRRRARPCAAGLAPRTSGRGRDAGGGVAPETPARDSRSAPEARCAPGVQDPPDRGAGPADGLPVILLHGWPYGIHSFVDVTPALASAG